MIDQRQLHPIIDSQFARWLAVGAWMALIFFLSAQSQLPSPDDPWLDFLFKKSAHFAAYAILAFLFWRALALNHRVWLWSWLLTVVYACSDEIHQSFVENRHPAVRDVVIDACGAATALLIIWYVQRHSRISVAQAPVRVENQHPS
jgi:VanZ family protein